MKKPCTLRISHTQFVMLHGHLFPGDTDEHGAVLLASLSDTPDRTILIVREVHLALDGSDYVPGTTGYRALSPRFIHRVITRARDERLVYLAVHNHFSDDHVSFSEIDLNSHQLGYPALLQISRGVPVGALVFGSASVAGEIWINATERVTLAEMAVIGTTIRRLRSSSRMKGAKSRHTYDRQTRMFGEKGQLELSRSHVAIIGLGGIGSMVAELLARIGVGKFTLVDADVVEESNLSRIVGSIASDAQYGVLKVDVAKRCILEANSRASICCVSDDVAKRSVAKSLVACDYLFLAADSMRARLVFNALVHQYLIPGVQLGSKVRAGTNGKLIDVMSVVRLLRPGWGCLWCNGLIDGTLLARECKTDEERKAQAYGIEEPNPSVASLNAVSASHAVNDFLLDYLALRPEAELLYYDEFHFLTRKHTRVQPRQDPECGECSPRGLRFGRGDSVDLPCTEG